MKYCSVTKPAKIPTKVTNYIVFPEIELINLPFYICTDFLGLRYFSFSDCGAVQLKVSMGANEIATDMNDVIKKDLGRAKERPAEMKENGKPFKSTSRHSDAGISILSNGIFFSWPSPFILKISEDKENYDISEEEASKFATLPSITLMIFCPILSKLSDIFGRKRILLMTTFVDLAVWILKATGRSIYEFYLARLLVGVSDAIIFVSLPAYLGEVAAPKVRGTWGNSLTVFFLLGELLVTVVGSYFNVQETCYILIPIPIVFFLLFSFMPESPYFYMMRGRYDEAKESLRALKRKTDISRDFVSLKADVARQMSEEGTWKEMLKIKSNRRALTAGVFLKASQILGGAQTFVIFAQYIFDKSKGTFTTEVSSMIYISLGVMLSIFACFAVDFLGRKKAYIGSLIPCSIVLFIESIYFFIYQNQPDINISSFHYVPIVGMVSYSVFSSYGIGIVPSLMLGELFSTSFRGKGMSIVIFATAIISFASNALFYVLSSGLGLYVPFLFFACCNMISAILSNFILPETKNKTLEEIQQALKGNEPRCVKDSETLIIVS